MFLTLYLFWLGYNSLTRFNLDSFDPVHSYDPNGMNQHIDSAYWTLTGNTVLVKNGAILTHDEKSLVGGFWNSLPVSTRNWMIEFEFTIHNNPGKIHGDGIAFWYVPNVLSKGNAFGADPHYTGAVVSIDTYENLNTAYRKTYPYISLHVSDGTKPFIHDHDGSSTEVDGCSFSSSLDGRAIRIYYIGKEKKFFVDVRHSINSDFKSCFEAYDIILPTGFKFGFTAATGGVSDLHKIKKVLFYNLDRQVKESSSMHEFDNLKPYGRQRVEVILPQDVESMHNEKTIVKSRSIFNEFIIVFLILGSVILALFVFHKLMGIRKKRLRKRLY